MEDAYDPDDIRGLTRGEHLLLWGFRMMAHGRSECPALRRAFADQCGEGADAAFAAFKAVVLWIGQHGNRRLKLHAPGCVRATPDELALVAMFASAQASLSDRDDDGVHAHLSWLMARRANEALVLAAQTVAAAMAARGGRLPRRAEPRDAITWPDTPELRVVH